jgi:hypothetical protein
MKELEKGGGKFMNVEKTDTRKRRTGAIIAAAVVVLFAVSMIVMPLWANKMDPAPKGILIFCLAIMGAVVIGVIIALIQRLKEVKGGEIDEARKYRPLSRQRDGSPWPCERNHCSDKESRQRFHGGYEDPGRRRNCRLHRDAK